MEVCKIRVKLCNNFFPVRYTLYKLDKLCWPLFRKQRQMHLGFPCFKGCTSSSGITVSQPSHARLFLFVFVSVFLVAFFLVFRALNLERQLFFGMDYSHKHFPLRCCEMASVESIIIVGVPVSSNLNVTGKCQSPCRGKDNFKKAAWSRFFGDYS